MSLKICDVLRQWRWAERRELKEVAAEIGVGESTLLRFERGSAASGETLARSTFAPQIGPDDLAAGDGREGGGIMEMLSLGSLLGDPRIGQQRRRLDRALRNSSYLRARATAARARRLRQLQKGMISRGFISDQWKSAR